MVAVPPAIIMVNNDLTDNVKNMLIRQLQINYVFDGYQFDTLIANDPGYRENVVRKFKLRILVVRNHQEIQNRDQMDLVIFVKDGLAALEINKFGPHGITKPVVNLYWGALGWFGHNYNYEEC